jgi:hypothetical protein
LAYSILLIIGAGWAVAKPKDPIVLSPRSFVYGRGYGEWSALWWQWLYSIPVADDLKNPPTHPLFVQGVVDCAYKQSGRVWFIGGMFVSDVDSQTKVARASRICTIPNNVSLFFPILNVENDATGQESLSIAQLRQGAKIEMNRAINLWLRLDDRLITDLRRYRVTSPVFRFSMPQNNLYQYSGYDKPPGIYGPAVGDGIYVMLAPLSEGQHKIAFHGEFPGFTLEITYNITSVPGIPQQQEPSRQIP